MVFKSEKNPGENRGVGSFFYRSENPEGAVNVAVTRFLFDMRSCGWC